MKQKHLENWREVRKNGWTKFVLVHGLLAWGLPMFIAMAFLNKPFTDGFTTTAAITHYIVWPLAGILFGASVWWISEWRFKRAVRSESAQG